MRARALFLLAGFPLAGVPALAHHSTAVYDLTRPATVTGIITSFEWSNPHAHIYLDATKSDGSIEHWTIDLDSPNALRRLGWTRDSVKPGDKITCSGARMKDGSPRMRCALVALDSGKLLRSN